MKFKLKKIVRTETEVVATYTKEQLFSRVMAYFEELELEKERHPQIKMTRPTVTGLALFLGFPSKQYMYDMIDTDYGSIIEFGLTVIEKSHEEQLYNPHMAGSKFWLTAQAGWSEKKEEQDRIINIEIKGATKVEDANIIDLDEKELGKRLRESGLPIELDDDYES